MQLQPYCRE